MKNTTKLLLLLPIIGFWNCKNEESKIVKQVEQAPVTTAMVVESKRFNAFNYSGTIEAFQTIPLSFQTTGIVEKIYVEVGDVVTKGQLLASVNDADMTNIYNTSLAKFKQAKDAFERLQLLHNQGSLPDIKWAEMISNMEQAQSMLDISKNNLEKCNLRAPEDGIIGKRNIQPGQSSLSIINSPIEIVKINKVFVKIAIPENEIGKITKELNANIIVSALNEKRFEGNVVNISPIADEISRTYCIKILVDNENLELKPGMVCNASLNIGTNQRIVLVPYKAVSKDYAGNTFVYVVSADKKSVKKQLVITGNYHDSEIEIYKGLSTGQTIVIEGNEKLSNNSLITL